MRKRKYCLAAITAAVLALQTPMAAYATSETVGEEIVQEDGLQNDTNEEVENEVPEGDLEDEPDGEQDDAPKAIDEDGDEEDEGSPMAVDEKEVIEGDIKREICAFQGQDIEVTGSIISNVDGAISYGGSITVGGDISAYFFGAEVMYGGSIIVGGSVSSNIEYGVISMDSSSKLFVGGDVIANSNATDIMLDLSNDTNTGEIVVVGTLKQNGNSSAIDIYGHSISDLLPNIIIGKMESNADGRYIWVNGIYDEESVLGAIKYIINCDEGLAISGTESYKTFNGNEYLVATENTKITITPQSGYSLSSVDGINVTDNGDGTYSIIVPRGGGVNIKALRNIIASDGVASIEISTDDSVSMDNSGDEASVVMEETVYASFQEDIQSDVKNAPLNGTLELSSDTFMSFNRKTMEEIAARPDMAVSVTYVYKGKKYKTVIPAGYPVLELLDENGYCGFLYLNLIFGSELVE